ncbi:MAG: YraN family protein [Gemmatimonadetes bacterium]|nr:YraN family protein [Gemmatimonadota bacterium]
MAAPGPEASCCVIMAASHEFGRECEASAARFLESAGWVILARNYRSGHAEIDLVACRDEVIAFVEVKGRAGRQFGHPLDAITPAKRREIARAARQWIARHGKPSFAYRFDAIAVTRQSAGRHSIEHIRDAWRL